jgi:hypothetical protein
MLAVAFAAVLPAQDIAAQPDYSRAERLLSWHASSLISGDDVSPNWIADSDRFWYRT